MTLGAITNFTAAVLCTLLAAGVLVQSRDRVVRWVYAAGLMAFAIESTLSALCLRAGNPVDFIQIQSWRLVALVATVPPWLVFSAIYSRGDAGTIWKKWRWLWCAATLLGVLLVIVSRSDMVVSFQPASYGFLPLLGLGWSGLLVHGIVLSGCVWVIISLERTFRASVGTLRWRIKFMVMGLLLIFGIRILTSSYALLYQTFNARLESLNSVALVIALVLMVRSLARAGQFEIELYPSQSVIKNSMTVLLVGGYLLVAGVLAKIFSRSHFDFALPKAGTVLVIALVLLIIALMSDRLRLLIARIASRHFQRPMYDYRAVWRQFTEAASSQTSLETVCRRMIHLVAEVFQAQTVSIWVFDEHERAFVLVSSTAQSSGSTGEQKLSTDESAMLQRFFSAHPDPIRFENTREPWAEVLRRVHHAEFSYGGNRACAPLVFRGDAIGLLIVGDRIGGMDFGAQDIDMFRCAADHTTSSILNVHLSRQLVQARQFEAFQTMATFFVHDLKNAASTLNLMLPNLSKHWDTPGFKEDALRGVSKTVSHINNIVSRLGQLRGELTLTQTKTDLTVLVADVLKTLVLKPGIEMDRRLDQPVWASLDVEQVRKVVINLVLNANEAISGTSGRIEIGTYGDDKWAGLRISDTGCGMPKEFLEKSLFRPFKTTKKEGLGIGMFQSRMIVEAHGGVIKVRSERGCGDNV